MNATGRSRLGPVPPAVLNGLHGVRAPRSGDQEPAEPRTASEARLVGLKEARAVHELASLLDPIPSQATRTLELLEEEIRTMFAAHPDSLRALGLGLAQLRAAESPEERSPLVAPFEELLEALTSRHGLWEEA